MSINYKMNYLDRINKIKNLSPQEIEHMRNTLLNTLSGDQFLNKKWPYGMPSSIDPKLIFVGVSMGASPSKELGNKYENDDDCLFSNVTNAKQSKKHFYYPDTKRYWKKLRLFSYEYFNRNGSILSECQSIELTSHFNLGTGTAGLATSNDVEKPYVEWVSQLLNHQLSPELVVFFGLNGILKDEKISGWWNFKDGIKVDWKKPTNEIKLLNTPYKFREWHVEKEDGKKIRLVMWPNHPSRPPFSKESNWEASVHQYIKFLGE